MFSNLNKLLDYLILEERDRLAASYIHDKRWSRVALPRAARSTARGNSVRKPKQTRSVNGAQISSEEAIRAGEQIALAAFASGLKLAAAFGTVAAKTAGLALASMASGADRFSELVKEEALKSYKGSVNASPANSAKKRSKRANSRGRRKTRAASA